MQLSEQALTKCSYGSILGIAAYTVLNRLDAPGVYFKLGLVDPAFI